MAVLLAPKMSKKVSKKVLPWFWMRTLSLSLSLMNVGNVRAAAAHASKNTYWYMHSIQMSFSPAVSHGDDVGIEPQEGRTNVISAAGSRTSLPLSHAQSKRGPCPPPPTMLKYSDSAVKQTLEKPGSQIFRSTSCLWKHSTQINQQHLTDVPSIVTHSAGGTGEVKWWNREWIAEKKEEEEGWW